MGTFGGVCTGRHGFPRAATAGTRRLAAGIALVCVAVTMSAGVAQAQQHSQAPTLYVNPRLQPIVPSCKDGAITEITECPANQTEMVRSINIPVLSWGSVRFTGGLSPDPIQCTNLMSGILWREHEGGIEANPIIRTFGLVEAWGTAQCTAPALLSEWERSTGIPHLSIYATDEAPLQATYLEGEICNQAQYREGHNKLSKCPGSSEREVRQLMSSDLRSARTLPWKQEFVWADDPGTGESTVQMRLGMASFGECGPGGEETTEANLENCRGNDGKTRCYPSSDEAEEVPTGCVNFTVVIPQIPIELPVYGSLEATWRNGAESDLDPGEIELEEANSGTLLPDLGVGSPMTLRGNVKMIGEGGEGLISLK